LSSTIRTSSSATPPSDRQREPEGAATAQRALDPQPSAVQLDEAPRQGQPEAGALGAGARIELVEDQLLVVRRDAGARVADGDLDGAVPLAGADLDAPAGGRELDGVR